MKYFIAISFIALLFGSCAEHAISGKCSQLNPKLWTETTTISITIGNSVCNNESGIAFTKVVSDSRCPKGANCIWEGEIKIELHVFTGNDTLRTIEIGSKQNSAEVTVDEKDYVITMKRVQPEPVAGEQINPREYVVMLEVSLKE